MLEEKTIYFFSSEISGNKKHSWNESIIKSILSISKEKSLHTYDYLHAAAKDRLNKNKSNFFRVVYQHYPVYTY